MVSSAIYPTASYAGTAHRKMRSLAPPPVTVPSDSPRRGGRRTFWKVLLAGAAVAAGLHYSGVHYSEVSSCSGPRQHPLSDSIAFSNFQRTLTSSRACQAAEWAQTKAEWAQTKARALRKRQPAPPTDAPPVSEPVVVLPSALYQSKAEGTSSSDAHFNLFPTLPPPDINVGRG